MTGPFPAGPAERAQRRSSIRQYEMRQAERRIRENSRSIKCGVYEHHAERDGGCANSGTGCLCECHDRASAT